MAVRIGVLSTYPPTQCGIATFARSLVTHLEASGAEVGVVRLVDAAEGSPAPVVHELVVGRPDSAAAAARALDGFDVTIVQHEYGIFGGPDGADVLEVMAHVSAPIVSVLHTVLARPTRHQHHVLARVVSASDAIVTMTETARARLIAGWGVAPDKVTVIPHGADDNRTPVHERVPNLVPVVLTWGLLGEGKGIEWALRAMPGLSTLHRPPLYQVVGETHPRVVQREGEAYRRRLESLTAQLNLSGRVSFDSRYLDGPSLRRVVRQADIVLLPYDSQDQVTSGVLTEAVASGKPVVSTAFPHAVELLSSGAGILVPQRDPAAIREALRRLLTDTKLAERMAEASYALAEELLWPTVAERYVELCGSMLRRSAVSVA